MYVVIIINKIIKGKKNIFILEIVLVLKRDFIIYFYWLLFLCCIIISYIIIYDIINLWFYKD